MIYIFLLIIILLLIAAFAVNEGFNQEIKTGPIKQVNIIEGGTEYTVGDTGYFLDYNNEQRGGRFEVTDVNDQGAVRNLKITDGGTGYALRNELSLDLYDGISRRWAKVIVTEIETLNSIYQPDTTQSGTTQSGTTQSGTTQSGTTQSGTTQSGTTQSGTTQSNLATLSNNSNCNFIPLGETLTKCKENCRKYKELHDSNNSQYSQCSEDTCDKKCAECNNDENCLWVKNNLSQILNNKEIVITEAKFNKLRKKIILKWKVKTIDIQKIKDLLRYDDKETKIEKILHMKNMIRQETPCADDLKCNDPSSLMKNINKYLDEEDNIYISRESQQGITLEETPYICKKNSINNNKFYIFVSSNIDREDTDLIIKTDNIGEIQDNKEYTYNFCVSDNKDRKCTETGNITLNRGLQYIFYISSPNKELTSNVKVVST